jgi:hypothetical protein
MAIILFILNYSPLQANSDTLKVLKCLYSYFYSMHTIIKHSYLLMFDGFFERFSLLRLIVSEYYNIIQI